MAHPECSDLCPLQKEWLGYEEVALEKTDVVTCSSPLNPLADVFLPSFIKYGESKKVNFDDFKKNCEKFCKTHGRILYDDLCFDLQNVSHVNHSDKNCFVDYDFDMSEIVKAGLTKLSDYDVCDIIQTHTEVLQSWVPNF